jgi:hypothetical protein
MSARYLQWDVLSKPGGGSHYDAADATLAKGRGVPLRPARIV